MLFSANIRPLFLVINAFFSHEMRSSFWELPFPPKLTVFHEFTSLFYSPNSSSIRRTYLFYSPNLTSSIPRTLPLLFPELTASIPRTHLFYSPNSPILFCEIIFSFLACPCLFCVLLASFTIPSLYRQPARSSHSNTISSLPRNPLLLQVGLFSSCPLSHPPPLFACTFLASFPRLISFSLCPLLICTSTPPSLLILLVSVYDYPTFIISFFHPYSVFLNFYFSVLLVIIIFLALFLAQPSTFGFVSVFFFFFFLRRV